MAPFKGVANWLGSMGILYAGGFLAVATFAFSAAVAVTLGFAVSIAVAVMGLAIAGLAFAAGRQYPIQGLLGVAAAAIATWTIVATSVFANPVALWLSFASALAYVGIATLGMAIHEVTTERVVHHLDVGERERAEAIGR